MQASTELEDMVSKGILEEGVFIKIPISELSMGVWLGNFNPRTYNEKIFRNQIKDIIQGDLKDFYIPKYDPSFGEDGIGISYMAGKKIATGKSFRWWKEAARNFMPSYKSRLGTKTEYIAFLAILIQRLVESGWRVQDACHAVCNDSSQLGNYWDSDNAKITLEKSGSRDVCGVYDLGNAYKILEQDEEDGLIELAGGHYATYGYQCPLGSFRYYLNYALNYYASTGWIILEENPYE